MWPRKFGIEILALRARISTPNCLVFLDPGVVCPRFFWDRVCLGPGFVGTVCFWDRFSFWDLFLGSVLFVPRGGGGAVPRHVSLSGRLYGGATLCDNLPSLSHPFSERNRLQPLPVWIPYAPLCLSYKCVFKRWLCCHKRFCFC